MSRLPLLRLSNPGLQSTHPGTRYEDHQMVVEGAADQAKPTAFDFVDCRSPVALPEQ
jgi:hypothetical protein